MMNTVIWDSARREAIGKHRQALEALERAREEIVHAWLALDDDHDRELLYNEVVERDPRMRELLIEK